MSCVAIIDDSVVVRKIVETSMNRVGIKCLGFCDGYEALRGLSAAGCPLPDLLFLDINLPNGEGPIFLREIQIRPQKPLVVVTTIGICAPTRSLSAAAEPR